VRGARGGAPVTAWQVALCNEVLAPLPFAEQCRLAGALGYQGLEIAPYTIADDPQTLRPADARALARIAADHGLAITGLHWLLVKPDGLSVTTPLKPVLARTIAWMRRLTEICAALGGSYLVHGSPKQRLIAAGDTRAAALERLTDAMAQAAAAARENGVTYLLEPLSADQTPLINTLAEAAAIVRTVGSPALKTMLDTSSASLAERASVPRLIAEWLPTGLIGHVQFNDPNRRGPGQGDLDFRPIVAALRRQGYAGVIAVEPFDHVPDGPGAAAHAAGYLKGLGVL
jgi:sugar phosphate isomerase/epimerase